ncbi:hypothetical protein H0H92_002914 [Tricholoma furcatifolium]|nr:hypothetical protein H0H92_002914 [Tricholoma furcatifolium]
MYPSNFLRKCYAACMVMSCVLGNGLVNEPSLGTEWVLGNTQPITWVKGTLDGIDAFDVEMTQLSTDGLTLIARNVPSTTSSLNVLIQDVPVGDDYFLLFVNSTHGFTYTTSSRFSIVSSSSSKQASPVPNAQTVTISGAPNPTKLFAVTVSPVENKAIVWDAQQAWSLASALLTCVAAALWMLRYRNAADEAQKASHATGKKDPKAPKRAPLHAYVLLLTLAQVDQG